MEDPNDGGSWYSPDNMWAVNVLKTGNLLFEMYLVGDSRRKHLVCGRPSGILSDTGGTMTAVVQVGGTIDRHHSQ